MQSVSLFLATAALAAQPTSQPSTTEAAVTQASVQDDRDEIIVEAPPTTLERRRELRKMAAQVIRRPRRRLPIASFFLPVCPKVEGVPAEFARAIEDRMRRNANELDINVRSSPDCKRNISVIFVPPEAGTPEQWLGTESELLEHLLSFQRVRVLEEQGPVRAWNITALRDADGIPQKSRAGRDPTDVSTGNQVRLGSRLKSNVTMEIVASVVLIGLEAAEGKSVKQLADYATLRSFMNTSGIASDDPLAAETILTLFQDREPPEELTEFDRALISKLYSSPRNSWASRIYSNVAARAINLEEAADIREE